MTELGHVAWENYSHQNLWDMILPADPAEVMARARTLDKLATEMDKAVEDARSAMQKLMSAWTGQAADTAARTVKPALDWATHAATTASEIAHRLGVYADAIDTARRNMPLPADFRQLDAHAVGAGPAPTGSTGSTAGKQQAVEVMRHYERTSAQAYHGLPTFRQPPSVGGLPAPGPAPQPPPTITPPPPPPVVQPDPVVPEPPAASVDPLPDPGSTALSSFAGPVDGVGVAGGAGMAAGAGGAGVGLPGLGAGGVGGLGGAPAAAAVPGTGPVSGAEAVAGGPGRLGQLAAAAEAGEEPGWAGFPPMGQGGGRGGRDGEHRNRYAGRPDLIGDLPPAFPPVLGQ